MVAGYRLDDHGQIVPPFQIKEEEQEEEIFVEKEVILNHLLGILVAMDSSERRTELVCDLKSFLGQKME